MKRDRIVLWCVVAAGLAARLAITWTGWAEGGLLSDDAYYYFTIASHIVAGQGSTFDGVSLTNGYHPLWIGLLLPIFAGFGSSLWVPVRLALTVSTVFDLATGLLLYRLLRSWGARGGALLAASFWFLSPYTLLLGLRGMEASASTFFVIATIALLARLARQPDSLTVRTGLAVGSLVGLAGLARSDNLVSVGLAVAAFAVVCGRRGEGRRAARWLLTAGATALIVVSPWFAWNLSRFGSIIQVSGQVKATVPVGGTMPHDWSSVLGGLQTLAYAVLSPFIRAARFITLEDSTSQRITLVAACFLLVVVSIPAVWGRSRLRDRIADNGAGPGVTAACAYLVVHTLLFGLVWRSYMNWYALPAMAIFALFAGLVLPAWWGGTRRIRPTALIVAGLFILFHAGLGVRFFSILNHGPAFPETLFGPRFQALAERHPHPVRAGAFNAGALAYVAPKYGPITVVNLDCLVNNQAFAAYQEGKYVPYLLDHVDVLLEPVEYGWFMFRGTEMDSVSALYRKWPDEDLWYRAGP